MEMMEIRERLRFFNRLLRIPELNVDNITIEDLNSVKSVLTEMEQGESFIPRGFLYNTMRILSEASKRSQIELNLGNVDEPNIVQSIQTAVNYLIDYKTNNPAP